MLPTIHLEPYPVITTATPEGPTRSAVISAVVLATLIGAVVRAVHVLLADFPLNDGALFLTMTRDLVENGFALPVTTSYNGADIPFVYPPLGFYVAGVVSLTGLDLMAIFRIVPFVLSVAAVPVVYVLAARLLPSPFAAITATVAFALMPRAFDWTLAGGGVTRGFGVITVTLVLWAAVVLDQERSRRAAISLGVFGALAALAHPESVVVGGLWVLGIVAVARERRDLLAWLGLAAAIAFALAGPWLFLVASRHGLEVIAGAGQSGFSPLDSLNRIGRIALTDESGFTVIAVLALIGLLIRSSQRDWRWAMWVAVVVIDPRGSTTFLAPIVACLAAVGVTEAVLPAVRWRPPAATMVWPDTSIGPAARVSLLVLVVLGGIGSMASRSSDASPLFALPAETREAMAKVGEVTPKSARVIVVSGTGWWIDAVAEWFPVIADRRSVATVQGAEWTGSAGWLAAEERHKLLQGCAFDGVACFELWSDAYAEPGDFVFLPRHVRSLSPLDSECCPALREPLAAAGYEVIFDDHGGTLLRIPSLDGR